MTTTQMIRVKTMIATRCTLVVLSRACVRGRVGVKYVLGGIGEIGVCNG